MRNESFLIDSYLRGMTTDTLERPTEVATHEQNPTDTGTSSAKWIGFAVILSAMILNILDSTILNVAAPSIQRDLSLSASALEWIAAAYTLAIAVGLLAGMAVVAAFASHPATKDVSFLWHNPIGAFAVVIAGLAISTLTGGRKAAMPE